MNVSDLAAAGIFATLLVLLGLALFAGSWEVNVGGDGEAVRDPPGY